MSLLIEERRKLRRVWRASGFGFSLGGWPIYEGWDPWVRKIENYGSFTLGIARATGVDEPATHGLKVLQATHRKNEKE